MRDILINLIKTYKAMRQGELTIGRDNEFTLTFGDPSYALEKVIVHKYAHTAAGPYVEDMHFSTVEDSVDEFMTYYKLECS